MQQDHSLHEAQTHYSVTRVCSVRFAQIREHAGFKQNARALGFSSSSIPPLWGRVGRGEIVNKDRDDLETCQEKDLEFQDIQVAEGPRVPKSVPQEQT